MSDWTSGYVSDVGYTYGYYPELQPHRLQLPFLEKGVAAPRVRNACELGFGQGVSVNIHAAATDVDWWGTDFNPAQASFAQELAAASGAGAQLFDQSFEDFCARTDVLSCEPLARFACNVCVIRRQPRRKMQRPHASRENCSGTEVT